MKKGLLITASAFILIFAFFSCSFNTNKEQSSSKNSNNKNETTLLASTIIPDNNFEVPDKSIDLRANDTIVIITDIDYKPKKIVIFMTFYDDRDTNIGQSTCIWLEGDSATTQMSSLDFSSTSTKSKAWIKKLLRNTTKVGLYYQDKNNMQFWNVETVAQKGDSHYKKVIITQGERKGNPLIPARIEYNFHVE